MTCFVAGSFTPEMMGYGGFATRHLYSGIFKLSMIVNSTEPGKLVTEEEEDNPLLLGLVEVSPAPMLHTDIVPSFEPTTVTAAS